MPGVVGKPLVGVGVAGLLVAGGGAAVALGDEGAAVADGVPGTAASASTRSVEAVLLAVVGTLLAPVLGDLNEAQSSHVHQVLLGWTLMALVWSHTTSRLAPVLRAVTRDLERVKAASIPDTAGLLARIDQLLRQVDELPAANDAGRPGGAHPRRRR